MAIYELDVFAVTDKGNEELKGGSTRLPALALELMVLLDGKTSIADITGKLKGHSLAEILRTAQMLLHAEHIKPATAEQELKLDFSYFFNDQPADAPSDEAAENARGEAEAGSSLLKLNGYYVSIARKAGEKIAPADGKHYSVLIVEDHADLQLSLKMLLGLEGFVPRQATNRAEIVAQLGARPAPDVILLDVNLPDANGFDILLKVRHHPQLKSIPIIMLTSQASREDVLRGLAGGADGYITKPFEQEALLTGIKAVLGMHRSADILGVFRPPNA